MEVLLYLFYLYVPMKQSLLIMQQNKYYFDRYGLWLKKEIKIKKRNIFVTFIILSSVYILLFVSKEAIPRGLLLLLLFVYGYVNWKKEKEKKYRIALQYTSRLKRLYCMQILVISLFIWVLVQMLDDYELIFLTPFIYFIPWISITVAAFLIYPMEQRLKRHYRIKAENKLNMYQNLIKIGITGSYGKTSVKTILFELLQQSYSVLKTPKSYNNSMGITKTIRELLEPTHQLFICEMGADHSYELTDLMSFVNPKYGVVTTIGNQHLETFHTMEAIIYEKMRVIELLPIDGVGFLNADNKYIRNYSLKNNCKIVWFGKCEMADYRYLNVKYNENGSCFEIMYHGKTHSFSTALLGENAIIDITCAIAVAHTLGVSWKEIKEVIRKLPYISHRLEKRKVNNITILDDAYNSNPQGAKCACDVIKEMKQQRIIMTPGFVDLGDVQEEENKLFGEYMADCADDIILVGNTQTKSIYNGLEKKCYPKNHIYIVNDIHDAFSICKKIIKKQAVLLIENDLPDIYHH